MGRPPSGRRRASPTSWSASRRASARPTSRRGRSRRRGGRDRRRRGWCRSGHFRVMAPTRSKGTRTALLVATARTTSAGGADWISTGSAAVRSTSTRQVGGGRIDAAPATPPATRRTLVTMAHRELLMVIVTPARPRLPSGAAGTGASGAKCPKRVTDDLGGRLDGPGRPWPRPRRRGRGTGARAC